MSTVLITKSALYDPSKGCWRATLGPVVLVVATLFLLTLTVFPVSEGYTQSNKCSGESCFPQTTAPFGMSLVRRTKSTYRYYGFKVFDAAVYSEPTADLRGEFLGKVPLVLKLCYHRELAPEDFIKSSHETLVLNPTYNEGAVKQELSQMDAAYRPVGAGDCYQISFKPGEGMQLALNGESLVLVKGDDFAGKYLGIWLSKYSFSESLFENLTSVSDT